MSVITATIRFVFGLIKAAALTAWFVTGPFGDRGRLGLLVIIILGCMLWRWRRPLGVKDTLPKDRPLIFNRRLHCRLRPDRGQASNYELWHNFGRIPMYRQSKRLRPAVASRWIRMRYPHLYAISLGRAQFLYRIWINIVDQILILAPPQSFKTTLLATIIMYYPGPVLCTSKKGDLFWATSGTRSKLGPVATFCPQELGGIVSTIAWNLIHGCDDYQTAERRADAFAGTVKMGDVNNGSYFSDQARLIMRAFFHAAGLVHADLRLVVQWVSGKNLEIPEMILRAHAHGGSGTLLADHLAGMTGPAVVSNSVVQSVLRECIGFMANPKLAAAVLPEDGIGFSPRQFLLDHGTLYMNADTSDEKSSTAALFACMANEMHYTAIQMAEEASRNGGARMDPPFLMALDEVTQICPIPLPFWLADSGSRAVQIVVVAHSRAQLADKWGDNGADTIRDTCRVKLIASTSDLSTCEWAAKMCGTYGYIEPGQEGHREHDRITASMIERLPDFRVLVKVRNRPPVVVKTARHFRDRNYRKALAAGTAAVALTPARTKALGTSADDDVAAFQAVIGAKAIEPTATIPAGVSIEVEDPEEAQKAQRRWQRAWK